MSDIYNKNNNINHSNNNRVIQGVHIKKRTHNDVMNMNAFEHQIHRQNIEYKFDPRPVVTRYVKNPSTIQGPLFEVQNASQEKHLSFLPNSKTGTFHGYARNVDSETVLRNQTFALQKCDQAQYIPDSGGVKIPSGASLGEPVGIMNPYQTLNYIIRSGPPAFETIGA